VALVAEPPTFVEWIESETATDTDRRIALPSGK